MVNLTGDEIRVIIEACAGSGVTRFVMDTMSIDFQALGKQAQAPEVVAPASETPDHAQINKDSLEIEEARLKEQRLRLMLIEDPGQAERMLLDGGLEDELEEDTDD